MDYCLQRMLVQGFDAAYKLLCNLIKLLNMGILVAEKISYRLS